MSKDEKHESEIEEEQIGDEATTEVAPGDPQQPPEKRKMGWPTAVIAVAAIFLFCCVLAVCVAAAVAVFSGGDQATPLPPTQATPVPVPPAQATATPTALPTQTPIQAYIQIDEPGQGAVLDISQPVPIKGTGAGLPEGNVIVEAIDRDGNVLDRQSTTLQGKDVGIGGQGTWQVELRLQTQPGMAGRIVAHAQSPLDNSTIAEDAVDVSFGSTPSVKPWLKIEEPLQGAVLDIDRPVTVSGMGGGLPEGNLAVQAFDQDENLLVEVPTTLQGLEVGTGGEGTWKVRLSIPAELGTPGLIVAIARSPADNSRIAEDWIDVMFGTAPAQQP